MDESRIPKCVERITRLDAGKPTLLFRRKAKKASKKQARFTQAMKDAMMAMVEVPRRGTEALMEQLPSGNGKGGMMKQMSSRIIKMRKRGMRMLGGK